MSDQEAKYFDLLTTSLGYINRVREVTPEEGNPFLSVTLAALRGSADNAQYTHFECRVAGKQAKAVVRELQAAIEGDHKVLVGFTLSDLYPEPLTSPEASRAYLRLKMGERKFEVFACVFVDNRHRIIALEELFQGTIDGASVHPRVVVQRALELNAAAVLFAHNHPSGVAEPSMADQRITQRLKDALALVDVRVLDHFIVTAEDSISFAE
jgi:DNA repair protein RadC